MIEYAFPPPPTTVVPIAGTDQVFPVRRIYCVGRNYLDHIREMGGDEREPPFFFQKPTDAIVLSGSRVPYPAATRDFQHEVELVLAIGKGGQDIPTEASADHVLGLAVGIDLTRRDVQVLARKSGRPWEIGKAFDRSAPISPIKRLAVSLPVAGAITLSVNDEIRQQGDLSQLIWSCAEIIAQLSTLYRLEAGDLIYTGTPAGVAPMAPGDRVVASIEALPRLEIEVADDRPTRPPP